MSARAWSRGRCFGALFPVLFPVMPAKLLISYIYFFESFRRNGVARAAVGVETGGPGVVCRFDFFQAGLLGHSQHGAVLFQDVAFPACHQATAISFI